MPNYVLPKLVTRRRRFGNLHVQGPLPLSDYSFWGTCRVLSHTSSGPHQFWPGAVPHQLWSQCCPHHFWPQCCPHHFWPRCCPHPFWPDAAHTHSGPMLSAPFLAWCCPHQSWPAAVHTHSGPVQPAPMPAKCSPHLSLPNAAQNWLCEGERMSVMTSSSGVPHHTPPIP